jgi:hypothetical protein
MLTETTIMLLNFAISAIALMIGLMFFLCSLVVVWHIILKLSSVGRRDDRAEQ